MARQANRSGATSVAELVLVAWLFGLIMAAVAAFAAHQGRLAALQRDRVRLEEAVRTGTVVLGTELRYLTPADLRVGRDSARIRAFRGGGPVCAADSVTVQVIYRGVRDPDPARDSVLLVDAEGERAVSLVAAGGSSECGGSLRMVLGDPAGSVPSLALVFETGAYWLSNGAIRYRRGQGGRQPLTEALLGDMAFETGPAGLRVWLAPDPDSLPRLSAGSTYFPTVSLNAGVLP
jgi:hypothetical protein